MGRALLLSDCRHELHENTAAVSSVRLWLQPHGVKDCVSRPSGFDPIESSALQVHGNPKDFVVFLHLPLTSTNIELRMK